MNLPYTQGIREVVLLPGVPCTALDAPVGTTATVMVSYVRLEPSPSGVITIQTTPVYSSSRMDLLPVGAEDSATTAIVPGGGSLVLTASSNGPTHVSVKFLLEPNPGAWRCDGCRTINPGSRVSCPACDTSARSGKDG